MEGMIGLRHFFGSSRRWIGDGLIVLAVVAALVMAVWRLHAWRDVFGTVGEAVSIVQVFVTALVIVAGGIFAYRKLQLFRDFEPHLTVTQTLLAARWELTTRTSR